MTTDDIATKTDVKVIMAMLESYKGAVEELLQAYQTKVIKKYVTATEVRKYFGFGRTTLDEIVARGKIKAHRIDDRPTSSRYFLWEDVLKLEKELFTPPI